jgi:hypothetical protein
LCDAAPFSTTETGSCESETEVEVEGRRELVFKVILAKELLIATQQVGQKLTRQVGLTNRQSVRYLLILTIKYVQSKPTRPTPIQRGGALSVSDTRHNFSGGIGTELQILRLA